MVFLNSPINADPWTPLVYKTSYNFDLEKILDKAKQAIVSSPYKGRLESGDARSSVSNDNNRPHMWEECQDFLGQLKYHLDQILTGWSINNYPTFVSKSWVNVHNKDGVTLEHSHGRDVIVASVYLQVPENSGNIEFRNPLEYHWAQSNLVEHEDKSLWYPVEVKNNDVLLFPGWLKHRTQISNSNQERWVMTFNFSQGL